MLANIWVELLKREKVGVTDSFFDLGGHSLLVIKLVARIRKLLQVEILPGLVFDHSSIEALAQALRRLESEPGQLERVAALRRRLMSLSPVEREALLEEAPECSGYRRVIALETVAVPNNSCVVSGKRSAASIGLVI